MMFLAKMAKNTVLSVIKDLFQVKGIIFKCNCIVTFFAGEKLKAERPHTAHVRFRAEVRGLYFFS